MSMVVDGRTQNYRRWPAVVGAAKLLPGREKKRKRREGKKTREEYEEEMRR